MKYVDWERYDGQAENLVALCVRKSDTYKHEKEVRLVHWSLLNEPVRTPGKEVDPGQKLDPEAIARGVLANLASLFPTVDFTAIDGTALVIQAWLDIKNAERLRGTDSGIRLPVDRELSFVNEVVLGPKAEPWILDLTRAIVRKYDLEVNVARSTLDRR